MRRKSIGFLMMTAVLVLAYLIRLLPKSVNWAGRLAPGVTYLVVMWLCNVWDVLPLPALNIFH